MFIIITGAIGIGKTTVCRKLVENLRNRDHTCSGFLTYKTPDKDIIIEDIQSGETENLASYYTSYGGPSTIKYFFNPQGIDFGSQIINAATPATILVIDEVGHLELKGEGFTQALEIVNGNQFKNCILVVRKELLPPFLSKVVSEPLIFETTLNNRNQLAQEIASIFLDELR